MSFNLPYSTDLRPGREQVDIFLGELLIFIELRDPGLVNGRRSFTADLATQVAGEIGQRLKEYQQRLELPGSIDLRPDLQPVPGSRDVCPVFRSRPRQGEPYAHALVRLRLPAEYHRVSPANYDRLERIVAALAERRGESIAGIGTLRAVLPDWLTTACNGAEGGAGGPGSLPQAISAKQLRALVERLISQHDLPDTPWPFHVRFTDKPANVRPLQEQIGLSRRGHQVTVLVLDTAPEPDRIKQPPVDNALLRSLRCALFDGGRPGLQAFAPLPDAAKVRARPFDATAQPGDEGHPYRMTDHGLFVAGLIHDIAPRAEIRLWRVLNDFGAGRVSTIFAALAAALRVAQAQTAPVVINMSLVINAPVKDWPTAWATLVRDSFQSMLEIIVGQHLATRCVVVAAAGNGSTVAHRRDPRNIARFDTLIAVAAATLAGGPADYADMGDAIATVTNGVASFGGNTAADHKVAVIPKTKGVLLDAPIGLVTSLTVPEDDPAGQPNETGWAAWSGSSFATPIISGLITCLLGGEEPDGRNALDTTNVIAYLTTQLATDPTPEPALAVKGIRAFQVR